MDSKMENYQKLYPHISPEMAQTLQDIAASPDQWQSSDAAAKSQIDTTLTRYQLEPGNMTRYQPEPGNATIVVIGTSGAGKSATANTLLGEKVFKEGGSAVAMTKDFQVKKTDIDGIQLTVVDTPGTWNTKIPTKAGFDVDDIFYVIVVNLASPRFGQAELEQLKTLKGHDRRAVLTPHRCMVVLTHADSALQQSSLEKYIFEIEGDPLHELLTEHVNGKVLAINNSPTTEYEQSRHRQAMLMNTMVAMKMTPPMGFLMFISWLLCMIKTFLLLPSSFPIRLCTMIKTFLDNAAPFSSLMQLCTMIKTFLDNAAPFSSLMQLCMRIITFLLPWFSFLFRLSMRIITFLLCSFSSLIWVLMDLIWVVVEAVVSGLRSLVQPKEDKDIKTG